MIEVDEILPQWRRRTLLSCIVNLSQPGQNGRHFAEGIFKRIFLNEQGNSEGFDSCDRPSNLTQIGFQIINFSAHVSLKFDGWPWKAIGQLFYITPSFVHYFIAMGEFKLELQSGNAQFRSKSAIFWVPCDLEIWPMNLKNNRAPLLYFIKLCASFQSHGLIQTGVTVRKCSIQVKSELFYPGDLEIRWMTYKNNSTPLLCYFKLCASFHNHQWIQTGVTVWQCPIWVKIDGFFCPVWPWKLTDDLEKQ